MKPIVAIPIGDPAGIGPEITVKALADQEVHNAARCVVVGDKGVIENALGFSGIHLEVKIIDHPEEGDYKKGTINLINLNNIDMDALRIGEIQAMTGKAAFEYIERATHLCLDGEANALATTTINKESLRLAEVPFIGHTEIIGSLTGAKHPLTMFQVRNLRVFFLSRHVSLREACDLVTVENIVPFIDQCIEALKTLGVTDPKIAIAGLNPHSGEHGLFGWEEVEAVIPAVDIAQKKGIDIEGPIGADSVFHMALKGKYDAVLSLYHDQGHIATKMVDFERTISITAGMPILRTSVDHGTALDIAGKGIASPVSLIEAIRLAAEYGLQFVQHMA